MTTQRELDEQWVKYCNAQDCADRAAEGGKPWAAEMQLVADDHLRVYNRMRQRQGQSTVSRRVA